MNRRELENLLPHRGGMLLLDEACLEEDGTSTGSYTVRGDEFFLDGHFPGYPVVPGVILCEMCAQSACVLLSGGASGKRPLYTGIDKVRFRSQVKPGDTVILRCSLIKSKGPFYFIKGQAFVGDRLCMSGEFSVALADIDTKSR